MAKDYYQPKKRRTRLTKLEEKRTLKQAVLFIFLTIALIIFLFTLGIPGLVKLVGFLGDLKSTDILPTASDTIAPPSPVIEPLPEAVKENSIKIKGYSEEGATIKLILNGLANKEIIAGKNGEFIFENIILKKGENEIKLYAVDSAGNKSQNSQAETIIFDNEPPELEILKPKDNDKFFDKNKEIIVEGKTEENITLYINDRFTVADSEGNFNDQIELNEGENQIIVKALDKAGNETEKQIKVSYIP